VNNEHDQFDPEFLYVYFKHTEFAGECVVSCYHSVIFRSDLQEYLEKIIISCTMCECVCVSVLVRLRFWNLQVL
jgi:hypothetical protein